MTPLSFVVSAITATVVAAFFLYVAIKSQPRGKADRR